MKFLIAPDSFKGSLTAKEAAKAMAAGIRRAIPQADLALVPMADGGEGTVQALVDATGGKIVTAQVHNPLNQLVTARYGILGDQKTAVIEMAEASGIQYVNEKTKNPLITTTYGTGELMLEAAHHGVEKIIIGIGGSATVDGGAGMAQAIGAKFLDKDGNEIGFGGGAIGRLAAVDTSGVDPLLSKIRVIIASDVTNPLTGSNGAAAVFGPQKGATPQMVSELDENLHHYATVIKNSLGIDMELKSGAGAAGGLGFGLMVFTNSKMEKGIEIVLRYTQLAEKAKNCDFVFTGEGKIDFQTKFGKTPYGVAKTAKQVAPHAMVIALAGKIGHGADELYKNGIIDAVFATPNGAKSLKQAICDAKKDVALTAENISRVIKKSRE